MRTVFGVLAIGFSLIAGPALAEDKWLSPEDFRARVEGDVVRTEHADSGAIFGHEFFQEGNRVTWRYPDGRCLYGAWWAVGETICYRYRGMAAISCLRYSLDGGQLTGHQWDPLLREQGDTGELLRLTPMGVRGMDCAIAPTS